MIPGGYFQPNRQAPQRPSFPEPPPQEEMIESTPEVEEQMNAIPPDAVCYHTEEENCGVCEYKGADGICVYLQMPVGLGHCTLFEFGDQAGEEMTKDVEA